jgi:D-glycero-alpha-D-manno-heptose 1-phosphate guanylyltransferase
MAAFHHMCGAHCTLALKPMKNFERYGLVQLNKDYSLLAFREKQYYEEGLINGDIRFACSKILEEDLPEVFSSKQIGLKKASVKTHLRSYQDAYFIDIGIPEDYERAQVELIDFSLCPLCPS